MPFGNTFEVLGALAPGRLAPKILQVVSLEKFSFAVCHSLLIRECFTPARLLLSGTL